MRALCKTDPVEGGIALCDVEPIDPGPDEIRRGGIFRKKYGFLD